MRVQLSTVFITCALMLVGCGEESASDTPIAKPLPNFEFRGLKPGVTTVDTAKKDAIVRDCRSDPDNEFSCSFVKYQVGSESFGESHVIFRDGKFDWFTIRFRTDGFEGMGRVLMQVYGDPCEVDSKPLQNAFGAQFSGDEVHWCFKEGKLKLRRHMEDNVMRGELDYFTSHPEDQKEPPVYNATTL